MARSDQKPILLAEDNEDDAYLFKRALQKAGLKNPVHVAPTAEEAKDYLGGRGVFANRDTYPFPSVFAIDFHLPDLTGFELLKWVRAQPELQGLHCIVITGDHRPSIFSDCYTLSIDSFLYKPCSHEDLQTLANGFPQHWLSETPL